MHIGSYVLGMQICKIRKQLVICKDVFFSVSEDDIMESFVAVRKHKPNIENSIVVLFEPS